jgi:tetratricopeptide (TPR) repeat protein
MRYRILEYYFADQGMTMSRVLLSCLGIGAAAAVSWTGGALGVFAAGVGGNLATDLYKILHRRTAERFFDGWSGINEDRHVDRALRLAQINGMRAILKRFDSSRGTDPDPTRRREADRFSAAVNDFLGRETVSAQAPTFSMGPHVSEQEEIIRLKVLQTLPETFDRAIAARRAASEQEICGEEIRNLRLAVETAVLEEIRLQTLVEGEDFPPQFLALFEGKQASDGWFDLFVREAAAKIGEGSEFAEIWNAEQIALIKTIVEANSSALSRIDQRVDEGNKRADVIQKDTGQIKLDTATLLSAQELEAVRAEARHSEAMTRQKRLERLMMDAAGSGAASVLAISGIRDLLRAGNPEIDEIAAEHLPGLVKRIIEELRKPGAKVENFEGAVRAALSEAQARVAELAFAGAAEVLDKTLAQIEAEDIHRALGRAALLAERGRVARLQIRYRDAAKYYLEAFRSVVVIEGGQEGFVEMTPLDPAAAWAHLFEYARALESEGCEFGDSSALNGAVEVYGTVLAFARREHYPVWWAATQGALGQALVSLGTREPGNVRLEQAIAAYRAALEEWKREGRAHDWASAQDGLGSALLMLGQRKGEITLVQEAIRAFQAALDVETLDEYSIARTLGNLGTALALLGHMEHNSHSLSEAVLTYRAAISAFERAGSRIEWGKAHNNLGLLLFQLGAQQQKPDLLEEAIVALRHALRECTRERIPVEWALAQVNMGKALVELAKLRSTPELLPEAVIAFRLALEERTRDRVPRQWVWDQIALGDALLEIGKSETASTKHLEEAVAAYSASLNEWTYERTPKQWATAKVNIGASLLLIGEREKETARLKEAVATLREALTYWTRNEAPSQWASAKANLANALTIIGQRERDDAYLADAICVFREALEVTEVDRHPNFRADVQESLALTERLLADHRSGSTV